MKLRLKNFNNVYTTELVDVPVGFAAQQIRWKTIQLAIMVPPSESYMTHEAKFCVSLGSYKKTRKLLGCNVNLEYLSKPIAACSSNSEEKLYCVCCQHIYLSYNVKMVL